MVRIGFGCLLILWLTGCAGLGGGGEAQPDQIASDNDQHWRAPHFSEAGNVDGRTEDIWARIRADFRLGSARHKSIQSELKNYTNHPHDLIQSSERASPFIYLIADQVSERGMPGEIALVPFVESRFRPKARSPRNAAGLWQIMPKTGRRFGLDQNWWYDGRRDVLASTDAALDYLTYLNGLFDGDWLLALAAYNAGEGRVRRAISHNAMRGHPTDFWHLKLPKETRRYVPKILAVAKIVGDPQHYNIALAPIPNRPVLAVAQTTGQMELSVAAEFANIPVEDLHELNAGFRRRVSPPGGPHQMLLPSEAIGIFELRLAEAGPQTPVDWRDHKVAQGETLSHIARRYGLPVAAIRDSNQLASDRIRAGSTLIIPTENEPQTTVAGLEDESTSSPLTYTVRRGDSLWSIASRFGVSHRSLADWNDISLTAVLRPGHRLLVWT